MRLDAIWPVARVGSDARALFVRFRVQHSRLLASAHCSSVVLRRVRALALDVMARALGKAKPPQAAGASSSSSLLSRLVRLGMALYVLCAVATTAHHFVLAPVLSVFFPRAPSPLDASMIDPTALGGAETATSIADPLAHGVTGDPKVDLQAALARAAAIRQDAGEGLWSPKAKAGEAGASAPESIMQRPDGVEWLVDQLNWHPSHDKLAHVTPMSSSAAAKLHPDVHRRPTPMAEDFFLSKAFGESLQPSKVIPYFYRASTEFAADDITITTLVTSNRFTVLAALVERYQGAWHAAETD